MLAYERRFTPGKFSSKTISVSFLHLVRSHLPGQRIVLQALVTAVLFIHVTCVPPPHVLVHSVQQVLPEIQNKTRMPSVTYQLQHCYQEYLVYKFTYQEQSEDKFT